MTTNKSQNQMFFSFSRGILNAKKSPVRKNKRTKKKEAIPK